MKKIIITMLLVVSTLVLATAPTFGATTDRKIDVEIIRDNTTVDIKHLSDIKIDYAVVEFAYMRDDNKLSELKTFEVKNNKFEIKSNVIAIKLHQIKTLVKQTYYTYATAGKNTIGTFEDVTRINIVEIETVDILSNDYHEPLWNIPGAPVGQQYHYWEFYFNFDKPHDKIRSATLNYVAYTRQAIIPYVWVREYGHTNVSEKVLDTEHIDKANAMYKLEKNTTSSVNSDYVIRFAKSASGLFKNLNMVENVAMVQIEYLIDGEFIVADVINDPMTPDDDNLNWLLRFIEQFRKFINSINWDNALTYVLVFLAVIIGIPLLMLLISIIGLVFKVIKVIVKLIIVSIKNIFKILKWAIVPKKKRRNKK